MSDEVYRPQKQSINMPQENQRKLEEMAQMRSQIDGPDNGIQMTGTIPPQLQQMINKNTNTNNPETPQVPQNIMPIGSSKLQELLSNLQNTGMLFEEITLPSRGVFYDGTDGPTDGKLHIRPMTGEEEEILATSRFVQKGQAINMIFNKCIQEAYNAEKFLTQDRTYLLIYLRGISYTPEYDVEIRDPDTDQMFATTIDLNSLYVEYCPDDFGVHSLCDVLPKTGYNFRYRLARVKDEQEVQAHRERRIKNFNTTSQPDDTLLFRTALMIEEIEGLTNNVEIVTLLRKLPVQDVSYLRSVVNEPPFGVNTKVSITSPYSLNEFEVELPLEANFFFPRIKKEISKNQA